MNTSQNIMSDPVQPRHAPTPRYSTREWDIHKPRINQLYVKERRTLNDTMTIVEIETGFKATAKQFKTRLRKWGFDVKNVKGDVMLQLARTGAKRKILNGKESAFRVAAKDVPEQKIDRYLKRNGIEEDQTLDMGSPERTLSPAISVYTPGRSLDPDEYHTCPRVYAIFSPSTRIEVVPFASLCDIEIRSGRFQASVKGPAVPFIPPIGNRHQGDLMHECGGWGCLNPPDQVVCSSKWCIASQLQPHSLEDIVNDVVSRSPRIADFLEAAKRCPAFLHAIFSLSSFSIGIGDDAQTSGTWHYLLSVKLLNRMLPEINGSDRRNINFALFTSLVLAMISLLRQGDEVYALNRHLEGALAIMRFAVGWDPSTELYPSQLSKTIERFVESFEDLATMFSSKTASDEIRKLVFGLLFRYLDIFSVYASNYQ